VTGVLQPLDQGFQIVDGRGFPTLYFIQWAQQRQIDISAGITAAQALAIVQEFLTDHPLIAGAGIGLSPSGNIGQDVTISAQVQEILDQLSTTQGSVIFRGAADWEVLAPGASGQFLKTNGAGANPAWAAGGGGGGTPWYWNPPTAASFATLSGDATLPLLTDDPDIGLSVDFQPLAAGTNVSRFAYRTLSNPAGDWVMTAHFEAAGFTTSRLFGLAMRDSIGGRSKLWVFRFDNTDQFTRTNLTSLNSGATATSTNVTVTRNPMWLRMQKSGANLILLYSGDGKNWYTSFTESITAYLANAPSQVGLHCMYSVASVQQQYLAVDNFTLTGTAV